MDEGILVMHPGFGIWSGLSGLSDGNERRFGCAYGNLEQQGCGYCGCPDNNSLHIIMIKI